MLLKSLGLSLIRECLFLVLVVVEKLRNILTDMRQKLFMEELCRLQLE